MSHTPQAVPPAPLEGTLDAEAPALLEAMNASFADALLLVGRVLGERPDAERARAVGIDHTGLDLVVAAAGHEHPVRLAFATAVHDADEATHAALALVVAARAGSDEAGETTAERLLRGLGGTRTFVTSVAAVADVHPHLRRITFAGGDLATFSPLGPDTFLHLLLPPPGRTTLSVDQEFTWEAYEAMAPADRPVGAYYTVRAWRPDVAELDVLFVLHEPAGPACTWAATARPGDPVAWWGPREAFTPPAGTGWFLLVADETGLPAVAAILEALPPGTPVQVVAEVGGPAKRQDLPVRPGVHVTWVQRGDTAAGAEPGRLLAVVRTLELPAGDGYAWGGAESRAVSMVRRHLRQERGMGREQVSMVGYWRRADGPGAAADDDIGEASEER